MNRPTILDLDLVVVPREATERELRDIAAAARDFTTMPGLYPRAQAIRKAMLSASPYPTAWDDVRKYVEEMERERDEATGTLRYCEKQWSDERGVMIDKFVYERNRAEAAERQLSEIAGHMDSECDSDSILHVVREAEADRDIYKDRAEAAEALTAELEKRLADAERVQPQTHVVADTVTPQEIRQTAAWECVEEELRDELRRAADALEASEKEATRLRRMVERRDELIIGNDLWDEFKGVSHEAK